MRKITAVRCPNNPLVTFKSLNIRSGNINGPSVIRVPSWIRHPLGKYYMYFADHRGEVIRLAYADDLGGPWKVFEPGTLRLDQTRAFRGHIASPDVHVDDVKKEIRMYFHGGVDSPKKQQAGIAFSKDGLRFDASETMLGSFYFRVFRWGGFFYAIAKDGNSGWGELLRSPDGLTPFESRGPFIENVRHTAVMLRGNRLIVFYSRKGDAPERILVSTVMLVDGWTAWMESEPVEVLRPETGYEGAGYLNRPSDYGAAVEVRQLRDPFVFEENGRTFLFYSVAGEMGIAMAEISIELRKDRG